MSSHHFVKEGQEPALFIVDPVSLDHIQPLLEWAPLVIVLDSAIDEIMRWGIKIDVVLGESSQLEKNKEKVSTQFPVEIVSYKAGHDPITAGLHFLISQKQNGVNLVTESFSSLAFNPVQVSSTMINVTLITRDLKWSFIVGGVYEKWFPAKTLIKIKSGDNKHELLTEGINVFNSEWFMVEKDGPISIRSIHNFWIGEELADRKS